MSASPMTLGRLVLETARGDLKRRELTEQETRELWESISRWRRVPAENTSERDRYDEARREYRQSQYDYEEEREE